MTATKEGDKSRDGVMPVSEIPRHVREEDENAYTPRLVFLGPIHFKNTGLEWMEALKLRFVNATLRRSTIPQVNLLLDRFVDKNGKQIREFCGNFNGISCTDLCAMMEFTRMMGRDCCFVIELLRLGKRSWHEKLGDHPVFATRWMPHNLGLDLLLLENQLPLFVLNEFFELTRPHNENDSLVSLALQFITSLGLLKDDPVTAVMDHLPAHFLALFHSTFTPTGCENYQSPTQEPYRHTFWKGWMPNAKVLHLSGITFKPKSGNTLDIEFKNRELRIPPIILDHTWTTILRNLVAYEQQDKRVKPYFTSLVVSFSDILCTTDDARLLMKSGIIKRAEKNEEEIVKFFNSIVKELVFDMNNSYLHNLIEDVNCSTQSNWAKFRSILKSIIPQPQVSIMEVALLIISFVQTFLLVKYLIAA